MKNVVVTTQTTVTAPAAAMRHLKQAQRVAQEIADTNTHLSDLAAQRAEFIRSALETGISQSDVARILGVSPQAVHNILRQH